MPAVLAPKPPPAASPSASDSSQNYPGTPAAPTTGTLPLPGTTNTRKHLPQTGAPCSTSETSRICQGQQGQDTQLWVAEGGTGVRADLARGPQPETPGQRSQNLHQQLVTPPSISGRPGEWQNLTGCGVRQDWGGGGGDETPPMSSRVQKPVLLFEARETTAGMWSPAIVRQKVLPARTGPGLDSRRWTYGENLDGPRPASD